MHPEGSCQRLSRHHHAHHPGRSLREKCHGEILNRLVFKYNVRSVSTVLTMTRKSIATKRATSALFPSRSPTPSRSTELKESASIHSSSISVVSSALEWGEYFRIDCIWKKTLNYQIRRTVSCTNARRRPHRGDGPNMLPRTSPRIQRIRSTTPVNRRSRESPSAEFQT